MSTLYAKILEYINSETAPDIAVYRELYLAAWQAPAKYTAEISILYRLIFYTRDISHGKGEYRLAYAFLQVWLKEEALLAARANNAALSLAKTAISRLVNYGSWKDLKYLCNYLREASLGEASLGEASLGEITETPIFQYIIGVYASQLNKDALTAGDISMLAKWLPREKSAKFGWLAKHIAVKYYSEWFIRPLTKYSRRKAVRKCLMQYRRLCAKLNKQLETVQIAQCANAWSTIKFEKVSRQTMNSQYNAFLYLNISAEARNSADRIECKNNYLDYMEKQRRAGTGEEKAEEEEEEEPAESMLLQLFQPEYDWTELEIKFQLMRLAVIYDSGDAAAVFEPNVLAGRQRILEEIKGFVEYSRIAEQKELYDNQFQMYKLVLGELKMYASYISNKATVAEIKSLTLYNSLTEYKTLLKKHCLAYQSIMDEMKTCVKYKTYQRVMAELVSLSENNILACSYEAYKQVMAEILSLAKDPYIESRHKVVEEIADEINSLNVAKYREKELLYERELAYEQVMQEELAEETARLKAQKAQKAQLEESQAQLEEQEQLEEEEQLEEQEQLEEEQEQLEEELYIVDPARDISPCSSPTTTTTTSDIADNNSTGGWFGWFGWK